MTAEVALSGPAMAKRKELRQATMAAPTAAVRKVTATPVARNGASGPEKISAAKDRQ